MEKFIDLQLFAEETPDTVGDNADSQDQKGTGQADQTNKDTKQQKNDDKKPTDTQPKYTDEDVDKIINRKFAEWEKKQEKAVSEAKKLAEMNATEKAEYERDKLQKELDELKKANSIAEISKTARKMLSDEGITIPDELLSLMVTTDAEETKAAVDGFSTLFKEAVENAVKEKLKGNPPKVGTGGGAATMTKETIMAIKNDELRQQKMLENKHLFKSLN